MGILLDVPTQATSTASDMFPAEPCLDCLYKQNLIDELPPGGGHSSPGATRVQPIVVPCWLCSATALTCEYLLEGLSCANKRINTP